MKSFARLFAELDASTATRAKQAALVRYFSAFTDAEVGSTDAEVGSTDAEVGSTDAEVGSTDAEVGSTAAEVGSTAAEVGSTDADVGNTAAEVGSTDAKVGRIDAAAGSTDGEVGLPAAAAVDTTAGAPRADEALADAVAADSLQPPPDDAPADRTHDSLRDAAWAVYFLAGGKPRQTVPTRILRDTARDVAALPEWLFDECYQAVGDLAETIAHVLPPPTRTSDVGLATWIEDRLLTLKGASPETAARVLAGWWDELDTPERFLLAKLIGGAFRVGVSKLSVTRALATVSGLDAKIVAHRLMGYTDGRSRPSAAAYRALIAPPSASDAGDDAVHDRRGQPYPFFLAHALNEPVERFDELLGPPGDWQVEWKYDGIRGQLVVRGGECFVWSRGEDLVTERFPELAALVAVVPSGTVVDGEILVWRDRHDAPAPFADLQTRIGRKTLSKKLLAETPVVLVAYDLLEEDGVDLRTRAQSERRARLEALVRAVAHPSLRLSPVLTADSWTAFGTLRAGARARGVEGFMLKRRDARYGVGRTKDVGVWWKWKIDPLSVDAVLVYAQRGHGRRASLYTDFTFAVWDRPQDDGSDTPRALIPFAKAYSGLTDAEILKVDAIVKRTTVEKFGPVRSVRPTQVFELGFEGIQRSTRHKSGIATRFPRMLRWRTDKPIEEADTLASLEALIAAAGRAPTGAAPEPEPDDQASLAIDGPSP